MDALNRHLKSETRVECAKVVERGEECWGNWIVGWRQIRGGGADISFGVTL